MKPTQIALLATIVAVMAAGCASNAGKAKIVPASPPPQGWTLQESAKDRFSVALPPGWVRLDTNSAETQASIAETIKNNPQLEKNIRTFMSQEFALSAGDLPSGVTGFMNTMNVIHKTGLNLSPMDDDAVSAFRKGLETQLPVGVRLISVERVELEIGPAIVSRLHTSMQAATGPAQPVVSLAYFIPNSSESYTITFATMQAQEETMLPLFRRIANTFRIKAP
jgi:hypothetical protein